MSTHQTTRKFLNHNFQRLNYVFLRQTLDPIGMRFRLSPKDSDFGPHETVLTNLVGTLVKLSDSGTFEPYIAESFTTSNDGLTWTFTIRPNLRCEDGFPITAQSFAEVLKQSLKRYAQSSKVIDFELLEGWHAFAEQKSADLPGITHLDNQLIFKLTVQPENFIGHLRLPYFGFWCPNNFKSSGEFKDEHMVISSGAYSVVSSAQNKLVLKKREEWFSTTDKSPTEIHFMYATPNQVSTLSKSTIIEILGRDKALDLPTYSEIKSPPSLMWSMVVSPIKDGPFQNIQNRQAFADRINSLKKTSPLFSSFFFYPSKPNAIKMREHTTPYATDMAGTNLKFAFANKNYTTDEISEIKRITIEALKESGASIEFHQKDPHEDNWRHRLLSNEEFDIRMNGVDQGGYPKNRTIKMMFCSKLGVCYPDPSNRICQIVAQQDRQGGPIPKHYIDEFNQALYDDASVIPLTHFGTHWLMSPDIDPKTLPPSSGIFHFEGIHLK